MIGSLIQPEIQELIAQRNFTTLREVFSDWLPEDLAELIADIPKQDTAIIYRLLPQKLAATTFEFLEADVQTSLLEALSQEQVALILNDMSPDDRTALLEELPLPVTTHLLGLLSHEERIIAQMLLAYPEGSIGRLMTPDFIDIKVEWTVQNVLNHVRQHGHDRETLNVLYVTNDDGKLLDDIRIREFLLSPLDATVADLMDEQFVALSAMDTEAVAVQMFKKHNRIALPVVNASTQLIGIITVDDVLNVAEERDTEEIQRFGGTEALDEPYSTIPFFRMIRKRASWLILLFLGEMLTATAMGAFEEEISKAVVLALFLPLIISSGGNSGSQAATLIIRAMALGEITLRDWWRVMRREIFSGLTLGTTLGVIGFFRIAAWSMFSNVYGEHWLLIGFTVGFSLIGVVLWGTLSGSMLPFLLKRLGADPATSSAPFVATLVDVTGLIIYFSVGLLFLRGTLL